MDFSINNFMGNLKGILLGFNEIPRLVFTSEFLLGGLVLDYALGFIGYSMLLFIMIGIIIFIIQTMKDKIRNTILIKRTGFFIIIPFLLGVIFVMFSTSWRPWSFRYFAGFVLTVGLVFTTYLFDIAQKSRKNIISIGFIQCMLVLLVVPSVLNIARGFLNYGGILPASLSTQKKYNSLQKKLLSVLYQYKYSEYAVIPGFMELYYGGGNALVLCDVNISYYQFFGENNCIYVDLAYDRNDLIHRFQDKNYDLIVIATGKYNNNHYAVIENRLKLLGYSMYFTKTSMLFINNNIYDDLFDFDNAIEINLTEYKVKNGLEVDLGNVLKTITTQAYIYYELNDFIKPGWGVIDFEPIQEDMNVEILYTHGEGYYDNYGGFEIAIKKGDVRSIFRFDDEIENINRIRLAFRDLPDKELTLKNIYLLPKKNVSF
jgi:hypothetical protein